MVADGRRYLAAQIAKGIAPEQVATTIVKAAEHRNPRLRYVVPASAGPLIALLTALPGRLADRAKQRAIAPYMASSQRAGATERSVSG